MKCSHCQTENTKKNGHTHYGKQNYDGPINVMLSFVGYNDRQNI